MLHMKPVVEYSDCIHAFMADFIQVTVIPEV